jgi:hypothetical protein
MPQTSTIQSEIRKMASIKIHQKHDIFTAISHVNAKSENRKIGNVAQTWHLTNQKPSEAYTSGNDKKVCGDCPLRSKHSGGNGVCYVTTIHGPNGVHSSHRIKDPAQRPVNQDVQPLPESIDKPIRFGAYGDPVNMPLGLMRKLAKRATGHIGYTHQWHKAHTGYSEFLMASIDPAMATAQDVSVSTLRKQAKAKGYRTFRVLTDGDLPMADEIQCPNESRGIQCADCGLCNGAGSAKSITIRVHGTSKNDLK